MTEKERFKLHIKWFNTDKTYGEATLTDNGQPILCTERIEDARLLKNLLKELYDENEQLKEQLSKQGTQIDFLKDENKHMRKVLEENKQLKQRNTNQYNQLNELWQLIEAKDWETLTAMDNQMKEYEEQLKREWGCYE